MKINVFARSMAIGKDQLLRDFSVGCNGTLIESQTYETCDIAVMLGTVNNRHDDEANVIRKQVLENHNGKIVFIDGHVFRTNPIKLFRVSLNSIYFGDACYCNHNVPSDRWKTISQHIRKKPWIIHGDYILILMQRIGGWQFGDLNPQEWLDNVIRKIRQYSNRKIVIKLHPSNDQRFKILDNNTEILPVRGYDLETYLVKAHSVVTHNSSAAIDSIVAGVPVFLTDTRCLATPVANFDFSRIEQPVLPSRETWLNELAYAIWSRDEMKNGSCWQNIAKYL